MRWVVIAAMALASACSSPVADEPQILGGVEISASVLRSGRRVYLRNCAPCHGVFGDGRGPAATASWPPPRDFTAAKFKFAGITDRGLPADAELYRVVKNGLPGSSMPPWDLPASEIADVVDYIKAFSPEGRGFRDPSLAVSTPAIPPDPFTTDESRASARARGELLYHAVFECSKCHPSYREGGRKTPAAKWSDTYRSVLLPTDFGRHLMRSIREDADGGANLADLYRVIAFGLQGPMPGYAHLGPRDVWAVSHYVKSLAD